MSVSRQHEALALKRSRTSEEQNTFAKLDEDMRIATRRYQRFVESLKTEFAVRPRSGERVYQLREAQGLMSDLREMGPGTVILLTFLSDERYHVILITPQVQKAVTVPIAAAQLSGKVFAFRQALQNPESDPAPLARELYSILIGPSLARDLEQASARTLMWSLDGVLRYLPVAALHDGRQYLVERFHDGVHAGQQSRIKDLSSPWPTGLGVGVSKALPGFSPLPRCRRGLRGIIQDPAAGDAKGILRGRVLLDEAFTESALRTELSQRPPVVHIASHFQFRPGNETDSSSFSATAVV